MSITLRDALLVGLAGLPGTREFHLHVLVSSSRKNSTLYPFARPRPKVYVQDILILLSEQTTPDSPRILVAAVEACVYHIPSTSCAIFYVAKIDSTGHSAPPSPIPSLVRSLLTFYADPATRPIDADHLWIHLFARAQGQYLFPNSSEYPGKRVLSDIKLCAWWKRVFTEVARELETRVQSNDIVRLFHVLPGYNECEAANSLRFASSALVSAVPGWIYGHPYSQSEIPLPCPRDNTATGNNLGHYIPSFDDDPKSRFLDEIAYITEADGVRSPARKRSRTASHNEDSTSKGKAADGKEAKDSRPLGELGKVSADEFWERMSFRQECVAGAVAGFFAMGISSSRRGDTPRSSVSPLAPQPGQVSSQINKRIMTTLTTGVEFSTVERSIRATETLEGAIKGLCEGITPIPTLITQAPRVLPVHDGSDRRTPRPASPSLPSLRAPPRTPPHLSQVGRVIQNVSLNPFAEPVASLETYHSYIYGSIYVRNPSLSPKTTDNITSVAHNQGVTSESEPHVTVLTVRKKKKRAE